MKYETKLAFYSKLLDIIDLEEKELPYELGMEAIELYNKTKDEISLPEFTADHVNALHTDFDVREDYAEAAFQDLAPHLRDSKAREVIEGFISCAGTGDGDDLYAHVKNVRPLTDEPYGPAVVTLVVHWYGNFKALLSKDEGKRPNHVHGSFSEKASKE